MINVVFRMNNKQKERYEQSLNLTLQMFKEGKSVLEIADKRKLAFSTIENHLQRLLGDGMINLHELINQEKIELIKRAINGCNKLKEIKERLPEDITYGEIKYILTFLGRFRSRKYPIEAAINTYMGNYCYRKCFNHDNIILECRKRFMKLIEKMKDTPLTFKEFNRMMKDGEIKVCKFPLEKRRKYISWKYFEYLKYKNKDYWDI